MEKPLSDVPDVLYKYRDWNDEFHKKLLLNRELYFSSIIQFNDPFDGTIPHRYNPVELTEANIFQKYFSMTKEDYPHWNDQQIHDHCYKYQQRQLFLDEKHTEDFAKWTTEWTSQKFGVVCLSKERNNFLMWSHYANSHTGYCIGFDKFKLFEDTHCRFEHVDYAKDLPTIGLFEGAFSCFRKLMGTKSEIWEYEKEYRLTKPACVRKTVLLSKETICELLLGCKMEQKTKFEIIEFVSDQYKHLRVYDLQLSKTKFETVVTQVL